MPKPTQILATKRMANGLSNRPSQRLSNYFLHIFLARLCVSTPPLPGGVQLVNEDGGLLEEDVQASLDAMVRER